MKPVSIVTVSYDTAFFLRLLVEKVREFIGAREYEIVVADRGSRDGTLDWCATQADLRVVHIPQSRAEHEHGEAAERAIAEARHEIVAFLDSDAHPISADWLTQTADRLDARCRLAGPKYVAGHRGNPFGWYVHPHFMVFHREDLGREIVLRKMRGETTDTGEEATIRLLEKGFEVAGLPLASCPSLGQEDAHAAYAQFSFGHPHFPTIGAEVFHAWYGTRLGKDDAVVGAETAGAITAENYREPLVAMLRKFYRLDY